jgi:nitrite reductase (NADH) small subunit
VSDPWIDVCPSGQLIPEVGVCALVGGEQVAVFRVRDGSLHAVGNHDPAARANVISRGIVGDHDGVAMVASPLFKHRYALETGRCIDEPSLAIPVFDVREHEGHIQARLRLADRNTCETVGSTPSGHTGSHGRIR